ncbi:MAG: hypothetical protein QG635_51 [Bacteroidota bacterium]|nr:hypothetical protein [Bacteroidota bacterium]
MRIAFLSVFYPYRGGIAQFNGSLFRALEKKHEIRAFNFSRQYPDFLFPGKTQYVGTDDTADPIPSLRCLDSINPLTYIKTANEIKKFNPDLLLLDYWMPFFAPSLGYPANRLKKNGVVVLSLLSNIIPHEPKPGDNFLTKKFLNQCHGYIILADALKKDLTSLKPEAKYICHHHPNYRHFGSKIPQNAAKQKIGIPDGKKTLLFFGLIRHYKGLDILLQSMKELDDSYYLIIAGEVYGNDKLYSEIIKENNLESRILFVNKYLADSELSPYFSAADACVLPYRTATQSGIVGVSYNFELPVITTDVGGLKEVVEPYGNGIVIAKADVRLLAEAIESYFNRNMKEKFVENIRASAKYFSWEHLADSIADFYEIIRNSLKS